MADVERVAKISTANFHRLESEVAQLRDLCSRATTQYPSNPLLKKISAEAGRLHSGFFVTSVPLADPGVATLLLNETIKANKELTEQLGVTKEWIMSSSLVKGNAYLNEVKIGFNEIEQALVTRHSGRILPPQDETLDELVLQIEEDQEETKEGGTEMARLSGIQEEAEELDELLLNRGEGSVLLGQDSPKLSPRTRSARKTSGRVTWRTTSQDSYLERNLHKPSSIKRESYLIYKEQEDKMSHPSLNKTVGDMVATNRNPASEKVTWDKIKVQILEMRDSDESRLALMHGLHKALAASMASLFFILPYFSQFSVFPVWVAATAVSVTTTYAGSSVRRCFNETLGSMVGALLGYGVMALVALTGPDCIQCAYKPYVVMAILFVVVFGAASYGNKFKKWEQVLDLAISSFLLIVGVEYLNNEPSDLNMKYVLDRASMIMTGVLIAFVTSYMIFPVKGSKRIQRGLKNVLQADIAFVLSGVMELYSNPYFQEGSEQYARTGEMKEIRDFVAERKKVLYASASTVFSKTSQMRALIDTTQGEVIVKSKQCKPGFFPASKYNTIMFCTNQLMYITLTLFYGLQGGASNTAYCHLFSQQLETIRIRFEKLFVTLSTLLESDKAYLDALAHIQVIKTLLDQLEKLHSENLVNGVVLKYGFDEVQAFFHLWTCLKLYMRKVIHLVDSIMRLYET